MSAAGGEVWAAGEGGTIVHRSGSTWQLERSGGPTLRALWAVSAGEAWAAGDTGTLLHYQR